MFTPPALVPLVLSTFLAEHVKGQLRLLILVASSLMKAPWLPTVFNMLANDPWHCPIVKISLLCFGRPCAQVSAISAFNPLAAQMCVVQIGVLFLILSGGGGNSSIYNEGLRAMLEGMARLVCSRGYTQQ